MDNLKTLEDQAAKGDAGAQYRLAAQYDRQGRRAEARQWTEKAAASGHPGALYTCAAELLSAKPGEMRVDDAVAMLKRASDAGGPAAMRQLGVLTALGLGVSCSWKDAVALSAKAAKQGYPPALRELAALSSIASEPETGSALMRAAAMKGDWIAAWLGLRKSGVFTGEEAKALSEQLKKIGAPLPERFDKLPKDAPVSETIDIDAAVAAAEKALATPERETGKLNEAPDIVHFKNVLSTEECDYLICASAGLLQRSKVVDPEKAAADHAQYRTSDEATFGILDLDLALFSIYARLAAVAGVSHESCELMGVLRYRPGQEYKPHHDYLPEDASDYSEVKRSGQRAHTILVPLNDEYEGGETKFPKLDLDFAGRPGDVLVFQNTDDAGKPYPETLHAGAPVTSGEKWLLTIWSREKPFWFWV